MDLMDDLLIYLFNLENAIDEAVDDGKRERAAALSEVFKDMQEIINSNL